EKAATRAGMVDQRQRLQGLAEPHVVGQYAAELVFVERREPPEPLPLVRAKLGPYTLRNRVVGGDTGLGQCTDRLLPGSGLTGDLTQLGQFPPQAGLEPADAKDPGRGVFECPRLGDQLT